MLPLDDPRWATYQGGYRLDYDASRVLLGLIQGKPPEAAWQELWEELHHQGDVGEASYASVPWLLEIARRSPEPDWNPLALICTIELARPRNPDVPEELRQAYFDAILAIPSALAEKPCNVWDDLFTQVAVASLALSRGHRAFAEIYLEFGFTEAKKWLAAYLDIEENQLGLQGL
jgi:hypothetical protein